jgi:S1-C subfamily serine protease
MIREMGGGGRSAGLRLQVAGEAVFEDLRDARSLMSDQDIGHPHRCREGHRWQHTGPTAVTCKIHVDDSYAGGLPLVSVLDCPLCSGREELLKRGLHTHHCNICEGDWDHEGRCLDGPVTCCPWCFAVAGVASAPGARRGPHFHFCPACTRNWQHDTLCCAPLRAALPDCSGCYEMAARPSTDERAAKARAIRDFIRPALVPVSITAAGVILAIPILFKLSSTPLSLEAHSVAPRSQQRTANYPWTPVTQRPELDHATESARAAGQHGVQLAQGASSAAAQAHREGERRTEHAAPAPRSARIASPIEPDMPLKSATSALGHKTGGVEEMWAASSPPSPAPREFDTETSPEAMTPQSKVPTTSGTRVPTQSVPEALPRGGSAVDTMPQDPPRLLSAAQPPLWDRASISMVMRAVVDVRPLPSIGSGPDRSAAPSGREPSELESRPSRGFIIDELGHVATSDKRLGAATSVEVITLDGRTLGATVVARNRVDDVAVLKLQRRGLPIIALGNSGAVAVGDRVLAIGNGIRSDRTPTVATVLATSSGTGGNLAVDLTPKPDRVGGPLVNHLGQAVGIVTDSAPPTGSEPALTFAVPVDRVKLLLREP